MSAAISFCFGNDLEKRSRSISSQAKKGSIDAFKPISNFMLLPCRTFLHVNVLLTSEIDLKWVHSQIVSGISREENGHLLRFSLCQGKDSIGLLENRKDGPFLLPENPMHHLIGLSLGSSVVKHKTLKSLDPKFCNWDETTYNQKKKMNFKAEDLDVFLYGFPNGRVKLELVFLPDDQLIIHRLISAQLSAKKVKEAERTGGILFTERSDFKKVYCMLSSYYEINDRKGIFKRIVKYGTPHFPELQILKDNWSGFIPDEKRSKTLIFFCKDLKLYVFGFPDGKVSFEIYNLRTDETVWKLLIEAGINRQKIPESRGKSYQTSDPNDLKIVYEVLDLYYPFSEKDELMKGLALYGDWKLQELGQARCSTFLGSREDF